jgi:hypothetical protein
VLLTCALTEIVRLHQQLLPGSSRSQRLELAGWFRHLGVFRAAAAALRPACDALRYRFTIRLRLCLLSRSKWHHPTYLASAAAILVVTTERRQRRREHGALKIFFVESSSCLTLLPCQVAAR